MALALLLPSGWLLLIRVRAPFLAIEKLFIVSFLWEMLDLLDIHSASLVAQRTGALHAKRVRYHETRYPTFFFEALFHPLRFLLAMLMQLRLLAGRSDRPPHRARVYPRAQTGVGREE